MSTISRPRLKAQAFTDTWQVEIVDLTGIYVRKAGMKSAAILDGVEPCRVEEFAARHFRRSGFEATFLESAPFHVLFGVYFWSVIQDRCDRQVRTVGIMARPGHDDRNLPVCDIADNRFPGNSKQFLLFLLGQKLRHGFTPSIHKSIDIFVSQNRVHAKAQRREESQIQKMMA